MTDGLLENIIQLERHIQAEIAAEQARAEQWRQSELASIEDSLAAASAAEEERSRQMLAQSRIDLKRQGAAVEAAAVAWCQRLSELDDATLRDVLKRHLAAILPGGDHDHPHGQS